MSKQGDAERPLYGRFAWAYDLVVPRPAGGEVDGIGRRLEAVGVPAGAFVIDAGCGTGRYARGITAAGYRVTGVDRSAALIDVARAAVPEASFVCADLLTWQPPSPAAAVLCRGVLNDLITDDERRAAFAGFASWLVDGGVLLADVRDWEATAQRYAAELRHERIVGDGDRTLRFSSETQLDPSRHIMRVRERYRYGSTIDETSDFQMRCWTGDEVRARAATAGFADVEVTPGADAGLAADRLSIVARR